MIKLFWNTHNQIKFDSNKSNKDRARDQIWGKYHKDYSDKWIFEILEEVKFEIIENENSLKKEDTLIIVDSNIEVKDELYSKIKLICNKIFLIHLGDEAGIHDFSSIYDKFNFVWRTFCTNKYFDNKKISCFPLGYKSGTHFKNNINERKYKWAFIGTPHKSSRHDLLYQLSNIEPFFSHKTIKFNNKIINVDHMSEVLTSTEFIPCPYGFVHPETYRLYEALECGCIPIVENAYKYYDRLLPNNPFLKIDKWVEAKSLIQKMKREEIKHKQIECKMWWKKYKSYLQKSVIKKIQL